MVEHAGNDGGAHLQTAKNKDHPVAAWDDERLHFEQFKKMAEAV